jgi:glycosyltransferase 2 family protein
MTENADDPRPLKLRILRAVPVLLVLGLLVHFLLPRIDTIENSLKTMRTLVPWAIALSVAMQILSYAANGALLQSVVRMAGGRMSFRRAAAIEIGAGSVALVAAGVLGFGAAIYRWARGSGVSAEAATVASWLPSVFDSAALVLFALLARNDWMKAISKGTSRFVKRFRPRWDASGLHATVDSASAMWEQMRRGGWLLPASCSLMVLTFDLLTLRYAFLATGHSLHLTLLLAGYGVPLLLGRASFLPGGIGVVEVAMAALYGGLGVPASAAVVAVLAYRLISFWLPAVLGIPIAVVLQSPR